MGSVDRAEYMMLILRVQRISNLCQALQIPMHKDSLQDNMRVAEITQTIQKERALQRQYLEEQEQAGRLHAKPPTPKAPPQSLKERYGLPAHLGAVTSDPESAMALNFSRQLWCNAVPGYMVRDGRNMQSTMKDDFVWNEEEIDLMKQQRFLDKTHNRRRDEHTRYVECRTLYDAMMGKSKATGPTA